MNSLLFYEAGLKARVSTEMHILENGPHGFGMDTNQNDEAKSIAQGDQRRPSARAVLPI